MAEPDHRLFLAQDVTFYFPAKQPTRLHCLHNFSGTITASPTSPTEGVGRRQAAEILGTQLQRSALQGMSAHRDFSAVPGSDFRRRLSGKLELQLPKQEQLILLWLRITGQDDHPIVRRGQFD